MNSGVFIKETLSIASVSHQCTVLISTLLIVGRGQVCVQATIYMLVCDSDSVSFLLLSFKLGLGCLFRPHYVNQGGVQKTTPEVTIYEPHTAEESLRRRRSGGHSQVLTGHADQVRELLHLLLSPH